jgi:hypothetical protein
VNRLGTFTAPRARSGIVRRLRLANAHLVAGFSHLGLIAIGFQIDDRRAWIAILVAMTIVSGWTWHGAWRRWRIVADTPTARISSAAQGYAELCGVARNLPEGPSSSALSGLPCCWYRYTIEERRGDNYYTEEESQSDTPFLLEDRTGRCRIDPAGGEFHIERVRQWEDGDRRYSEWMIVDGDRLHALGEFRTERASAASVSRGTLARRLSELKHDPTSLLEQFDLNRDGRIDGSEWEAAVAHVTHQEQTRQQTDPSGTRSAVYHWMRAPDDDRPLIVSTFATEHLERRLVLFAWAHLGILLAAAAVVFALFARP